LVVKAPKPPSSRKDRRPISCCAAYRRDDVVAVLVFLDEAVQLAAPHRVDPLDELVDAPAVDRDAEPHLGLGLVALGVGDVAHRVAEAGQSQ